jgi:primosomal protein N' (replication factor Y)
MDSDTSRRRGARARILAALRDGEIDILVGTQMIAKGFDFPRVTLVGVVLADQSLNLPDFRSAERTFQLLTQVAGRAGRGDRPGRVIIQTYSPHHYSIRAACDQDYARFMRRELELRRELGYPPYSRMVLVRIEGLDPHSVEKIAEKAAIELGKASRPSAGQLTGKETAAGKSVQLLGPAPAPIERIKGRYRWQLIIKSSGLAEIRRAVSTARSRLSETAKDAGVHLIFDIDPVNML